MRTVIGLVAVLTALPLVCSAQPVSSGTIQISGVTSVLVNRQTLSTQDANGQLTAGNVDLTSVNLGFEGTYYVTARLGIGGLLTYQRASVESSDTNAIFRVSGGFFGPLAQLRLPLGGRSEFVLIGSDGGISASLTNQNTGVSSNAASHVDGRYWLAGGTLSFRVYPNASLDLGVRYQDSAFTGQGSQKTTAAGLLLGAAFSLYIH